MWLRNLLRSGKHNRRAAARAARLAPFRPNLEALEDRCLPSGLPPVAVPDVFDAVGRVYREYHDPAPVPPGTSPPSEGPYGYSHLHVAVTASGNVLHNDLDLESDNLRAVLVSGPLSAGTILDVNDQSHQVDETLILNADGSFTYTFFVTRDGSLSTPYLPFGIGSVSAPVPPDFSEPIPFAAEFIYKVTDGTLESAPTVVTIAATLVDRPDAPIPGITVNPTSGLVSTEAGGAGQFSVVLDAPPLFDVTIPISSSDASEGAISISNLTFTPQNWNVPQAVTVRGVDDTIYDGDVPYAIVTGSARSADPVYDGRNASDVSVINQDNDPAPRVSITDVRQKEGSGGMTAFVFTVTLSEASGAWTTVNYATRDGSARAGEDYQAAWGSLTFAPGETTQTITVWVYADATREQNETFDLDLTVASNATIDDGWAAATILDDDRR